MEKPATYNQAEKAQLKAHEGLIYSFVEEDDANIDRETVDSFGAEWEKFDAFTAEEIENIGNEYFDITDQTHFDQNSYVLDVGCGSGRWSRYLSSRVKNIEAIDPSNAVFSAKYNNRDKDNIRFTKASVSNIPFEDNSFDMVICLGVLHHIPDTQEGINKIFHKVKAGGHFLIYLYYSLDNRGMLYRLLFKAVNLVRWVISAMPQTLKQIVCDLIAITVYWPLARIAGLLKTIGLKSIAVKMPLEYYADKTFKIMRNDSLDRFGTPLEKRFSRKEIEAMLMKAGFSDVKFSDQAPYWHAVARK